MVFVIVVVAVRAPIKLRRLSARCFSQRRKCCIERMRGHTGGCVWVFVFDCLKCNRLVHCRVVNTPHAPHQLEYSIELNKTNFTACKRFCLSLYLYNKRDCAHLSATEHRTNPVQWKNKYCGINKQYEYEFGVLGNQFCHSHIVLWIEPN